MHMQNDSFTPRWAPPTINKGNHDMTWIGSKGPILKARTRTIKQVLWSRGEKIRDRNPGSGAEGKEKQADLRDVKALAGHSN